MTTLRHEMRRWICGCAVFLVGAGVHAAVRVYDQTEISYDRYEVIARIPVDSWRTVLGVPQHATREAAIQSVLQAAESAGAEAVVNLYCVGGPPTQRGHHCYGNAIRLRAKPQGAQR